jgi:thioredoxin 1
MNTTENKWKPVQIENGKFDSAVLESKQPVLVAFLASWSRPCAILLPVLDEIAAESAGKLKVVRVNADTNLDLSLWYDVRSVPTLLYFVAGDVRTKILGGSTKETILSQLELSGNQP